MGRFLNAGEESQRNYSATMLKDTVRAGIAFGSQPGTHPPPHRHGPGIHVTVLGGHGYSLIQSPAMDQTVRVDWEPGTVFVPPEGWWHAHYNTGPEPWDWLRIGWGSEKPKPGGGVYDYSRTPQEGGDQVAFEDMDPSVHLEFEEELKQKGIQCLMLHHPTAPSDKQPSFAKYAMEEPGLGRAPPCPVWNITIGLRGYRPVGAA